MHMAVQLLSLGESPSEINHPACFNFYGKFLQMGTTMVLPS